MADIIFKIDGVVFDLEEEGYSFEDIIMAMEEYLDLIEEFEHV